jgi:Na+/H+-dicarboxylate symporter
MPKLFRSQLVMSLTAVLLGAIAGLLLGPRAADLAMVSWVPIAMIKGLATPLVFLAIVVGLMDRAMSGLGVRRMFTVCAINASAAILVAGLLVNVLQPGVHLSGLIKDVMVLEPTNVGVTSWQDAVKALVPDSFFGPFVTNNIPATLILAILCGLSLRRMSSSETPEAWYVALTAGLQRALDMISGMIHMVLYLMPIAIFASVAKATGQNGLEVFAGLFWYVAICVGGMLIQILVVYQLWIRLWSKRSLAVFWRHARLPMTYSFGVNSSLATLPATLKALDDLKVSRGCARLGACVGTNFNNDGILLYEVAAILMLAQAAGLDWSLSHQIGIAGICVLATLGVSGFPEAGIVALTLVITSSGLPIELLPLLLPVDWLVARMRSVTNVVSDMTVSLAIDVS